MKKQDEKYVLSHVKDNPGCSSSNLDELLVHQLFESNLLNGYDITSATSVAFGKKYEYEDLNLTTLGAEKLEELSKRKIPAWVQNLLVTIVGGFLVLVLGSIYTKVFEPNLLEDVSSPKELKATTSKTAP